MIDLAAERARSLARREERERPERLRLRARSLLWMRWNASADEIRETIQEKHPKLSPPELEEFLSATLHVQQTERQSLPIDRAPAAPPATTPEPEPDMPFQTLTPSDRSQVRALIRRHLKKDPEMSSADLRKHIEAEIGSGPASLSSTALSHYITPIRKEFGPEATPAEPPKKPAPKARSEDRASMANPPPFPQKAEAPPVQPQRPPAAEAVAAPESHSTNGDTPTPAPLENRIKTVLEVGRAAREQAFQAECRALHAGSAGNDFIRLESEGDKWALRLQLTLDDSEIAMRVLRSVVYARSAELASR